MNTEKSLRCSNRCRDIVIFKLLGCRPPPSCISLDLFKGRNSHDGRTASQCQISSKSVKPRPTYGYFSILQDGCRRHHGFLKFRMFNGRNGLGCWTASACQILPKWLEPRLRYNNLSIFARWRSVSNLVKIDEEMRPWECPQRDTHTHARTDRRKTILWSVPCYML